MSDRDESGRFSNGNRFASPRHAITNALRRMVDPEAIAGFLLGVVSDPAASPSIRLQAAEVIFNRLEGKPLTTSVSVTGHLNAEGLPELPPGFDAMTPDERSRVLDDLMVRHALKLP